MKIVHIDFPFVFTDDGQRLRITDIVGTPRVGSEFFKREDDEWCVAAVTSDSECVNGVCPIR